MVKFLREFRDFAVRGNVIDMAVGIIIGAAFGKIVSSLVDDVMMPPLGKLVGGIDFSSMRVVLSPAHVTPDGKEVAETAIRYGVLLNQVITFTLVAFAVFMLIRVINSARRRFEAEKVTQAVAPPADIVLLSEIRDLLRDRR